MHSGSQTASLLGAAVTSGNVVSAGLGALHAVLWKATFGQVDLFSRADGYSSEPAVSLEPMAVCAQADWNEAAGA